MTKVPNTAVAAGGSGLTSQGSSCDRRGVHAWWALCCGRLASLEATSGRGCSSRWRGSSSGCSSSAATDHRRLHSSSAPLLQLCVDGGKLSLCSSAFARRMRHYRVP
eukprot:4797074-Prymnesium_polylepis.1